jgi:glucosylceramidase
MDGFGASLTDSSAWNIYKLPASQQQQIMSSLFDPSAGIGISWLRQPLGASDFAVNGNYSFDDMPAGQTDSTLANFSIAHDKQYIIPLLQTALSLNPSIHVMLLPWSPPGWMKDSGTMNGGSVTQQFFPAYADYLLKSTQAYTQAGVPIYAMVLQNEPYNSSTSYPTATLSATDNSTVVKQLKPALIAAGLPTKLISWEWNWDDQEYAEQQFADPQVYPLMAGTGYHCYAGDPSGQTTMKNAYPDKDIYFDECTGNAGADFNGDIWWESHYWLIDVTRNWARNVSLWNIALDQNNGPINGTCSNCRGLLTVDFSTSPATVTKTADYYIVGHMSKYVHPGAQRIDSNTFGSGSVEDVAFQNPDGSVAMVFLNGTGAPAPIQINWHGRYLNYTIPGSNYNNVLATLYWNAGSGTAASKTTVTPTPSAITPNQNVTVLVQVSGAQVTPTGTVSLQAGTFSATGPLDQAGAASLTIPANTFAPSSAIQIVASYGGDNEYAASSGTAVLTVNPVGTLVIPGLTLIPALNVTPPNQALAVQVQVVGLPGDGTPTGLVTLTGGSYQSTGTAVDSNGFASFNIPAGSLSANSTVTLTASYSGDGVYAAVTKTASVIVTPPPMFTIVSTPVTIAMNGGTGYSTITVTPMYGYTGTLKLQCSITAPSGSSDMSGCAISPSLVLTGTSGVVTTVTVTTPTKVAELLRSKPSETATLALCLPLVLLSLRKRRRIFVAMMVLGLVYAGTLTGCSGRSNANTVSRTPQALVYTVVVTATDSTAKSINASTTFNVFVQQ